MISAKIIADSISLAGCRVTTMQVVMHRFVLAEFNTHRMFSRNSASSRAIPIERRINEVINDPAIPLHWGKNQKGMQAEVELDPEQQEAARVLWMRASRNAILAAADLNEVGVHKQVTNRVLEPFLWHTAVVTATEWTNFFEQRCSPLAQPEIRVLAEAMREQLNSSYGMALSVDGKNGWPTYHLPYISQDEFALLGEETCKKVSVARCARVSYLTQEGKRDHEEDLKLYDRLASARPPHASPFEHVCRPLKVGDMQIGNLIGWRQLRHEVFGVR